MTEPYHSRFRSPVLAAFLGWGVFVSPTHAQDWVVRQVATGVGALIKNVDLHVTAGGDVVVGYALDEGTGATLARLPAGELLFEYESDEAIVTSASFDWDSFGTAFYSSYNRFGYNLRAGEDFGGFGGLQSGPHPIAPLIDGNSSVTMAVGRDGFPALAGYTRTGQHFVSRFDVKAGEWNMELLGPIGPSSPIPGSNHQALTFDSENLPALSFIANSSEVMIARRDEFGWNVDTGASASIALGTALAADPVGGVGFVYNGTDLKLMFGEHDGSLQSPEVISDTTGLLTPRSLAYDPFGEPAVVIGSESLETFALARLARREDSEWTEEVLPVEISQGSLSFDEAGNAYIAAVTASGIVLISKSIPALYEADFNLDRSVDGLDLAIWSAAYALSDEADADGDGDSDGRDFLVWQRQYTGTLFASADFNYDGGVDSLDLAIWQDAYGITDNADADRDGDSDGRDFLAWQRQYGSGTAPALPPAKALGVPEPDNLVIVFIMAAGLPLIPPPRAASAC